MDPFFRCGIADPHGVCDVKDLMGSTPLGVSPGSDFSVQPRIPEAAMFHCTRRANFALWRRTAIVENSNGIQISHRVFHRLLTVTFWWVSVRKNIELTVT